MTNTIINAKSDKLRQMVSEALSNIEDYINV